MNHLTDDDPTPALLFDGPTVTVSESGRSVTLTPNRLYLYRDEEQEPAVEGVALLDADGLVMLDFPSSWDDVELREPAASGTIPLEDVRKRPGPQVRAVLAGRAPGWRRVSDRPSRRLTGRRKAIVVCAAILGAAVMAYLLSSGLWFAWRGLSVLGHVILDLIDVKWLAVAFSPALLVVRPVAGWIRRRKAGKGAILMSAGGPYLTVDHAEYLLVHHGDVVVARLRTGPSRRQAFSLLLYRYESLTGLFVLDMDGRALHHIPGRWSAENANRFAERHDLLLSVHRIDRSEYLELVRSVQDASP